MSRKVCNWADELQYIDITVTLLSCETETKSHGALIKLVIQIRRKQKKFYTLCWHVTTFIIVAKFNEVVAVLLKSKAKWNPNSQIIWYHMAVYINFILWYLSVITVLHVLINQLQNCLFTVQGSCSFKWLIYIHHTHLYNWSALSCY